MKKTILPFFIVLLIVAWALMIPMLINYALLFGLSRFPFLGISIPTQGALIVFSVAMSFSVIVAYPVAVLLDLFLSRLKKARGLVEAIAGYLLLAGYISLIDLLMEDVSLSVLGRLVMAWVYSVIFDLIDVLAPKLEALAKKPGEEDEDEVQ